MVILVLIFSRKKTGLLYRTLVAKVAIFKSDVLCADTLSELVSGMSRSLTVPVSAKLRLCQPTPKTLDLAQRLEACGASWITLHARTVSARRRRQGAADLKEVTRLKDHMHVPIISNGNVKVWGDIQDNLRFTGADGVMIGETLLGNPWSVPIPLQPFRPHDSTSLAFSQTPCRTL
jgi:tRNA-dihydrouridine synthase